MATDAMATPASGNTSGPGPGMFLCNACRRRGDCRMGFTSETLDDDGVVNSVMSCARENEGGQGVAHGGWIAGALDEMVGHTTMLRGILAVTGTLEVRFVRPVPIEVGLVGRAWITGKDGRKVFVGAHIELAASGAVLATARATMVITDGDHFARHEKWLHKQLVNGADPLGEKEAPEPNSE